MSSGDSHTVACAVRDDRGVIHVAMNAYHFTGGLCAELAALEAAAAASAVTLRSILAVGPRGHEILAPFGRRRQVLLDTDPEVRVMLPGDSTASPEERLPLYYQWQRD